MKLVIAIVQNDFVTNVMKGLTDKKYRVTKLSSTGGFLKAGNTTLLIGTEDENTQEIKEIIKEQCKKQKSTRKKESVKDGYANIFILNMDQFKKI